MTLIILFFALGILLLAVEVIVPGAILGSTFYLEFRVLPRTRIGRRAFLTSEITGVSAAFGAEARALIGKSAEALTMLSPSGYIRVDGQRYEAYCQSGQVPAGTMLEVIDTDNFRLIVSQTPTNQPAI
ncbi:MAG: NfeD family protein [Verrucomicrobia bacterium]|nr:NfeD family protein [Verrucomicrobiota bacterium]